MNIPTLFLITTTWVMGQGTLLGSVLTQVHPLDQRPSSNISIQTSAEALKLPQDQVELISIPQLLQHPEKYHQRVIRLRGMVTRLELHLDETNHFIDFVFFLKQKEQRVLVFGRHDRTKGDIQLTSDRMVEVHGLFWKERSANGHVLKNNLEAQAVWFYPPLIPDQAKSLSPYKNT